ncbi:MAG: hypothetical protein GEU86_12515 [Actinophytocola sp.]|nr:hypothetical protein [Actinophytocola sp.]
MSDVLRVALENLGGIGSAAAVVVLLVYVIRNGGADRQAYQQALAAAEQRHAAEMDRVRARVDGLEQRMQELTKQPDEERQRRWHAEDVAAGVRRTQEELT